MSKEDNKSELIELYQPSNSSELDSFTSRFCFRCRFCDPNPSGDTQCELLSHLVWNDTVALDYPKELRIGKDGEPTCTKWSVWDWDEKGDPTDPDNPNVFTVPENQIDLFTGKTQPKSNT